MKEKIKVLIIEDTASDIETYQDTITTINMDLEGFEITATYKRNLEEASAAIHELKDDLDGAFIDLRLRTGTTVDVNEGNDLISEIYGKLRFPIIVLTNTPGAFDTKFPQSQFLQVFTKTDVEYYDVLMSVVEIYKTGITKILGKKGMVEHMLDNIFWKNISKSLTDWLSVEGAEKPLLRYTLTHLQEHLEISEDGSEFDNVLPLESYITPSIKTYFFTGDIIHKKSDKTKNYLILTPACDLAPHGETKLPKTKDILLAEIQPLTEGVFNDKIKVAKKVPENDEQEKICENAKSELQKIIKNNFSAKYYYLPHTSIYQGGLVNFQKLNSIKYSQVKTDYEKIGTVTSQFVKDIIAKFSFYYSRQGSPDFDFESIIKSYLN